MESQTIIPFALQNIGQKYLISFSPGRGGRGRQGGFQNSFSGLFIYFHLEQSHTIGGSINLQVRSSKLI